MKDETVCTLLADGNFEILASQAVDILGKVILFMPVIVIRVCLSLGIILGSMLRINGLSSTAAPGRVEQSVFR